MCMELKWRIKHYRVWIPLYNDVIENVKAVVVGHMTQKNYIVRGNVHLIDTGGVYSEGKLTNIRIRDIKFSYMSCLLFFISYNLFQT